MRLSSEEGDPSARSREDGRAQDPSERSRMFAQMLGKRNQGSQAPTGGGPAIQSLLPRGQADASEGASAPALSREEAKKPRTQRDAPPGLGKKSTIAAMLQAKDANRAMPQEHWTKRVSFESDMATPPQAVRPSLNSPLVLASSPAERTPPEAPVAYRGGRSGMTFNLGAAAVQAALYRMLLTTTQLHFLWTDYRVCFVFLDALIV